MRRTISGPLLELRDVTRIYGAGSGTVTALSHVTLAVDRGDYVALMGPSGSGKTTLLNVMGGLDRSTSGEVWFDGARLDMLSEHQRLSLWRHKVAYVFQEPRLLLSLSAIENVLLPTAFGGGPRREGRRLALEVLEQVGLSRRAHHLVDQLSGGEAQRVCIARTLLSNPLMILADEPTGNLDHRNRLEIIQLLERLHAQGRTVILVTHDREIWSRSRRRLGIHDGVIVEDSDA